MGTQTDKGKDFIRGVDRRQLYMLHHFVKKTQKTPRREIAQAKRELDDFKERDKLEKEAQAKERTREHD